MMEANARGGYKILKYIEQEDVEAVFAHVSVISPKKALIHPGNGMRVVHILDIKVFDGDVKDMRGYHAW